MTKIILLMLSLSIFTSCNEPKTREVQSITPNEAYGMLSNDFAIVVDVREENEIASGMIKDAKWFPTSKLTNDPNYWKTFVSEMPKNKEVLVYCAGGVRAKKIVTKLLSEGIKAKNLGGYSAWENAKLPTTKGQ